MRDALTKFWATLIALLNGIETGANAFDTTMSAVHYVAKTGELTAKGFHDEVLIDQYDKQVVLDKQKAKLKLT